MDNPAQIQNNPINTNPGEKVLPPKRSSKKLLIFLGVSIAVLMLAGLLFASTIQKPQSKAEEVTDETSTIVKSLITPTPFPFQEMTIPYLRSRSYESKLGELEERLSNSNYTSYYASYDSDGLKLYGQLTVPKGEKPEKGWPAIIFVHGYIPPSIYQTFSNYSTYVDYFARNGFVVFKVDLRGHAGSEGEPGGAYFSSDYVIDVLNAYSALQNSDLVNPEGIGLWGHSMAGNVTSRALAAKPDIPAIVIWGGAVYTYTDMQELGIDDNSYRPPSDQNRTRRKREEMMKMYGSFDPQHAFWKQVPMTNYLDGIKGAISLHHAVDDPVVDVGYSRELNELLDKTSIEHELVEYPSGGHNFTGASFTQAMNNSIEFFRDHLK